MPSAPVSPSTDDVDIDHLQTLLDALPAPLEPPDVVMLDGLLCGVLMQPQPVPEPSWWPMVLDLEGRAAPPGVDTRAMADLVRRRLHQLERAIGGRRWFDPWVYQLDDDASPSDCVMPWVAGFAIAMEHFPRAQSLVDASGQLEPLALLYQYLDADDLEDADELLAEIETMEPPKTLDEAVEDLVRGVLLMADITRPHPTAPRRGVQGPRRSGRGAAPGVRGGRGPRPPGGGRRG